MRIHSARLTTVVIAVTLASLLLAICVAEIFYSPQSFSRMKEEMNPEVLQFLEQSHSVIDTTFQRSAHRYMLAFSVIGVALCGWMHRRKFHWKSHRALVLCERLVNILKRNSFLLLIAVILLCGWLGGHYQNAQTLGNTITAIGIVSFIGGIFYFQLLGNNVFRIFCYAALSMYIACALIPGLTSQIDFSNDPASLSAVQLHHGLFIMGSADRLLLNPHWLPDICFHYGIAMSGVSAGIQRWLGFFSWGEIIRFLQVVQILFVVLVVFSYWLWKPKSPLYILLAALCVIPWTHNNFWWLNWPNHSGARWIGFPLAFLSLLMIQKFKAKAASFFLGFMGAVIFLCNFETGIAVNCGLIAFLWTHYGDFHFPSILKKTGRYAVGWILSFVFILLGVSFVSGNTAILKIPYTMFASVLRMSGGWAGMKWEPFLIAMLIFFHAWFVVIRGGIIWIGKGYLSFRQSFKISISVMILIWMTYYVARPHFWNFWSFFILYGFLIADYLNPHLWHLWRKKWRQCFIPLPILILCFFILPEIVERNASYMPLVWNGYNLRQSVLTTRAVNPHSTFAYGLWLPTSYVNVLNEKAELLQKLKTESNSFAYFTEDGHLMQHLTRIPNGLIYSDAPWESYNQEGYTRLIRDLLSQLPQYILFDDPQCRALESDLYQNLYPDFFARVRESLKEYYQPFQISRGWIIWSKKS